MDRQGAGKRRGRQAMRIGKLTVIAAALAASAAFASASLAGDALDGLTPMNSDGLGDVKGASPAEEEADPLLLAGSGSPPTASELDGASTLSGNEANSVSLGVISLTNGVEKSALSLSSSLLNSNSNQ
jgi:hypothetical protein